MLRKSCLLPPERFVLHSPCMLHTYTQLQGRGCTYSVKGRDESEKSMYKSQNGCCCIVYTAFQALLLSCLQLSYSEHASTALSTAAGLAFSHLQITSHLDTQVSCIILCEEGAFCSLRMFRQRLSLRLIHECSPWGHHPEVDF